MQQERQLEQYVAAIRSELVTAVASLFAGHLGRKECFEQGLQTLTGELACAHPLELCKVSASLS